MLAAAREVRSRAERRDAGRARQQCRHRGGGSGARLAADEFRRQMEVNFIGPIIATQAFGPLLGADPQLKGPKGRIVMISSVAGKNGNPLTCGLFGLQARDRGPVGEPAPRDDAVRDRRDHHRARRGEDADLGQGPRRSTFPFTRTRRIFRRCKKSVPSRQHLSKIGLPPETIAERIFEALTSASPKVRYQITPDPMRHLITAMLPKRIVDKIIAKRLGLMPPA